MKDDDRTRDELIEEVAALRRRVSELEHDRMDRKLLEEALKESDEQFRKMFDHFQEGLLLTDFQTGRFLLGNLAISEMLGWETEELQHVGIADIHLEQDLPWVMDRFEELRNGKIKIATDVPVKRKDGHVFYADISGTFPMLFNGRKCLLGVFRDNTEQRRAHELLRDSELKFRTLVESRPDAVTYLLALDENLPALYISPQVEKIFGWPALNFQEDPGFWLRCIHPEDRERAYSQAYFLQKDGRPFDSDYRIMRKDGRVGWVHDVADLMRDEDGRPISVLGVVIDITGRKREEEQTAKLNDLKEGLLAANALDRKLNSITDGVVEIFGADFARIWMVRKGDLCDRGCLHATVAEGPHICRDRSRCLHLAASSGRYTSTEGSHRRVPMHCYKIGRVASGETPMFIIDDVSRNPHVHDHEWARSLGLVAFAGFRLLSDDLQPMGVLALFRREPIQRGEENLLQSLADWTSQVILAGVAEEALRESEVKFRALFDHSPIGISIAQEGVTLLHNGTALRMFGYDDCSQVAGTPQLSRIAPHCRDELSEYMKRRERGEPVPGVYETEGVKRDGSTFHLYIQAASIELANGPATVSFFTDITRRKAQEEELGKYRGHLEELVKERTVELARSNEQLTCEIEERKQTEQALSESRDTLRETAGELRILTSMLFSIQDKERSRISRELHDGLGQELSGLKIHLSSLRKKLREDQQPLIEECGFLLGCIDKSIENTRRLCKDLAPYLLEELGLEASLEFMFKQVCEANNLCRSVEVEPIGCPLPGKTLTAIYRIFQEALNNVVKHSAATSVFYSIKTDARKLHFLIKDDGVGFDIRSVSRQPASRRGMGLFAMTERARMLGGSLEIRSETGAGTSISFAIPIEQKGT